MYLFSCIYPYIYLVSISPQHNIIYLFSIINSYCSFSYFTIHTNIITQGEDDLEVTASHEVPTGEETLDEMLNKVSKGHVITDQEHTGRVIGIL